MRLYHPWVKFPVERQIIHAEKRDQTEKPNRQCVFVLEDLPFPIFKRSQEISVLFILEPFEIKKEYNNKFLSQFDVVISWRQDINHPQLYKSWVPFPLFYRCHFENGKIFKSDSLQKIAAKKKIKKNKKISFLVSNKTITRAHKIRLDLAAYLEKQMPLIEQFGKNKFLKNKQSALDRYKYTIVIENQNNPDGFTEKIQDAFLAECLPFYWGCSNLEKYFPKKSFVRIPIRNKQKALSLIKTAIQKNLWKKYQKHIFAAKQNVLYKYNIYPACQKWEKKILKQATTKKISTAREKIIFPELYFTNNFFSYLLQFFKNYVFWIVRPKKLSY